MTIHSRIVDPATSVPETVYLRDVEYEDGTGEGLASEIMKETEKKKYHSQRWLALDRMVLR